MTIYELIDAENVRAREMASAYDAGEMDRLSERAREPAPLAVINELLQQSSIPVSIAIRANERLVASKDGSPEYSASSLSDGERNALLIAGSVLTAPPETLLIIDEPERHLHRAIISPLLAQLFDRRRDCSFVISTHDHDLPLADPQGRTLLLRSCGISGSTTHSWEADELSVGIEICDRLKRDLIGARRRILFVEGTESSLDKPLYSLVFPMVSVKARGSAREVEEAVLGARGSKSLHWLSAFGIVDSDGLDCESIKDKQALGTFAVPYYSVEGIYFHPHIIERVAFRQTGVTGNDGAELAESAIRCGVAAIASHIERLSRQAAKKEVRKSVLARIPNDNDLLGGQAIRIENDAPAIVAARRRKLSAAVAEGEWESVLAACSVRESGALDVISRKLGFVRRRDYEGAVRHLLSTDEEVLCFVRGLFGELTTELGA